MKTSNSSRNYYLEIVTFNSCNSDSDFVIEVWQRVALHSFLSGERKGLLHVLPNPLDSTQNLRPIDR
ncbi:hypothetical protein B1R32_10437 [Abditibacterium utsteinense]|uniref:Uncharacterized protein n=1 Tax=Abditibacterium utsteinense TaxID=1960156 RepID=A0A2S8SUS9_9BACT|nr:hypothetical protein B1R32_10437 [Abditibacterium utsteinense]